MQIKTTKAKIAANLRAHRRDQIKASRINMVLTLLLYVAVGLGAWALSGSLKAATLDIGIGIPNSTTHSNGKCNNCNEDNSIFLATYVHDTGWGLTGARFINSYYTPTTAVALSYTWRLELHGFDAIELRPVLGVMRGYTREQIAMQGVCFSDDVCPMAALSGTFMVTDWAGVTVIQFGPDARTWAFRLRFKL